MSNETTVRNFKDYLDRINMQNGVLSTLNFDAATGAPKGAADSRAKRIGYISSEMDYYIGYLTDKFSGVYGL